MQPINIALYVIIAFVGLTALDIVGAVDIDWLAWSATRGLN